MAIPQPNKHTLFRGASESTLARDISGKTVYSLKVDVPIKWKTGFPKGQNKMDGDREPELG